MTSANGRLRDPRLEYTARLETRRATALRYEKLDLRLSQLRLGLLALFLVIAAFSLLAHVLAAWWLILPSALFGVAVIVHARLSEAKKRASDAVTFYEKGLARIDDRWSGQGLWHDPIAGNPHSYAPDLDLFGRGSLFELLCIARTREGQNTLARWLSEPAARQEILARQDAIAELRFCLDLREALASPEPDQRPSSMPLEDVSSWGVQPAAFTTPLMRVTAMVATAAIFVALGADIWSASPIAGSVFLGCIAIAGVVGFFCRSSVTRVLRRSEHHRTELNAVSRVLQRMQQEPLSSKKIVALRTDLTTHGASPESRIAQLNRLLDLSNLKGLDLLIAMTCLWQWTVVFAPFSFLFWLTHFAFALESWRTRYGPAIACWVRTAGEFEALCALACYATNILTIPFLRSSKRAPSSTVLICGTRSFPRRDVFRTRFASTRNLGCSSSAVRTCPARARSCGRSASMPSWLSAALRSVRLGCGCRTWQLAPRYEFRTRCRQERQRSTPRFCGWRQSSNAPRQIRRRCSCSTS